MGRAAQLERLPDVGVPSAGVTNTGEVSSTIFPVPVTAFVSVTPPYVIAPPRVTAGSVHVPDAVHVPLPTEDVRVLLVNSSVVALPTRVSVAAGKVSVPDAAAVGTTAVVPLDDPVKVTP
jgi:hypothetical protein